MKRRLLWIHQNFVTAHQAGNARPVNLIAAMLEAGWQVDVVTGRMGYLDTETLPPAGGVTTERDGALAIHRLDVREQGVTASARRRAYRAFFAQARRHARTIEGVGLVYCSSPPPPQVLLSAVEAARRRVPLVLEVRDLWPAFIADAGLVRSRAAVALLEWIEALSYRTAARVIPVAPGYTRHLAAMGVRPENVVVAPTGGDPRLARVRESDLEGTHWRRLNNADGRLVVLYAGSFNDYYGLGTAIDAAALTPDVVWVFAGNGRARDLIEEASHRMSNVIHAGSLPGDELGPLYAAADAALVTMGDHPLLHLMLPGKLFDAMASGLPVLSTARGSAGAIVRAAQAGEVVEAGTPDALAGAVQRLASLAPCDRLAMGARGRAWILRHMNACAVARRVAAVLGEAAAAAPCTPRSFASAALSAFGDVGRRRSRRSIQADYGDQLEAAVEAGMHAWMRTPAGDAPPLSISPLLSTRAGGESSRKAVKL